MYIWYMGVEQRAHLLLAARPSRGGARARRACLHDGILAENKST